MNKFIIIGSSLSGKTTLVKHLRSTTQLPISELDEELTKLNGGTFPIDIEYKHKVLFPQIFSSLLQKSEIIFFTNAWYFSTEQLKEAKKRGFKIIQLQVNLGVLQQRNEKRKEEGYDDLSQYLEDMVKYQEMIKNQNIVDCIINGEQPVEKVISDLLRILHIHERNISTPR